MAPKHLVACDNMITLHTDAAVSLKMKREIAIIPHLPRNTLGRNLVKLSWCLVRVKCSLSAPETQS